MKKILILLVFLIFNFSFLINECFSQWIWQQSGTTSPILDIEFLNRYTGYYCGNGVIGKTTNAGENWTLLNHPATNKSLQSINPVDSNVVYCVGYFETILKSTNGGINWIVIKNGPWGSGHSYLSSYFINENTGWIGGTGEKLFKTTNGGTTIDSVYLESYMYDMYFKDSLEGVICGIGTIHKTTNGGANWVHANIQLHGHFYEFYKITFVNDQYGWVIGNSNPVYRTTDFGSNWDSIGYVTGSSFTYCVRFSSQTTGWAGGSSGKFFKSTDGGYTWRKENTGTFTGYIKSTYFYNDSVGWLVGNGGRIQYTITSGQTVTFISNNSQNIPTEFKLYQNYPNPFNPTTVIKFKLKSTKIVYLTVYNTQGREISTLVNEKLNAGEYEYTFDGSRLPSGVYFYRIAIYPDKLKKDSKIIDTKKMLLIK